MNYITNYLRIAGGVGAILTAGNFISVYVPNNQYIDEMTQSSYWIKNLPNTKKPFNITDKALCYTFHTFVIFGCSIAKGGIMGLIWPITAADFIYEYKLDRNWRKYYNLCYIQK